MRMPFEFLSDGCKVQGLLFRTLGDAVSPVVVLLPGFPGNEEDVLGLGQHMAQQGVDVLTFNYRGTYHSEGVYSLRNTLEDIQAVIDWLHQEEVGDDLQIETRGLILGGYSYGGGMALAYAAGHPEIKRLVSIAGTDHGEFAREYERNDSFAEMIDATFRNLASPVGPVRFDGDVVLRLTQNPAPYDLTLNAPALADRDILLIGGWDDPYVTIEHHILPLYRALKAADAQDVYVTAIQDDHTFAGTRNELTRIVTRWAKSRHSSCHNYTARRPPSVS